MIFIFSDIHVLNVIQKIGNLLKKIPTCENYIYKFEKFLDIIIIEFSKLIAETQMGLFLSNNIFHSHNLDFHNYHLCLRK